MSKRRGLLLLSLAAVLLVAAMIFFFSSQDGEDSSKLSGSISRFVLSILVPDFDALTPQVQAQYLEAWGHVIRKVAHFLEYALLALTLVVFLNLALRGRRMIWILLLAWLIATAYAGMDEWHQTFVSARAGVFTDVMIDGAGALAGAVLTALTLWLRRRAHMQK